MHRIALILSVITAVVALLGGAQWLISEIRAWNWRRKHTGRWLVLLACVLMPSMADANVFPAASCSRTDVLAAVALANDDDKVTVPAGTCGWSSLVTISKAITLEGAGVGQTIILDDVTTGGRLMTWTLVADKFSRMTGFEFQDGARSAAENNGIIAFDGPDVLGAVDGRRFRVDHNKFVHLLGPATRPNRVYGLIDNNIYLGIGTNIPIYVLNNAGIFWADARWADGSNFGTDEFVFIEDNYMAFDLATSNPFALIDAFGGARAVVRHNVFEKGYVEMHGTESSGRPRGAVAFEVYDNTFNNAGLSTPGNMAYVGVRSGSALIFNNSGTNMGSNTKAADLSLQRTDNDFDQFGVADGRNPWDVNDAGNPILGTQTVTSGTGRTVTVSGASFPDYAGQRIFKTSAGCNTPITNVNTSTNVFTAAGHGLHTSANSFDVIYIQGHIGSTPHVMGTYYVTVIDADTFTISLSFGGGTLDITVAGSGGWVSLGGTNQRQCSAAIESNTSTVITFAPAFDTPSEDLLFTTGDTFQINAMLEGFDQPGRSGGTNLNGVTKPVPPNPNDQVNDPVYATNNTANGSSIGIAVPVKWSLSIVENEHYFNDTQKPGYASYTYPHPLQSGGGGEQGPTALVLLHAARMLSVLGAVWHVMPALARSIVSFTALFGSAAPGAGIVVTYTMDRMALASRKTALITLVTLNMTLHRITQER